MQRERDVAERSFKREVQKLKLGDGEVFHGEGILAVTKALLQSGVSYVAGYQGAPISHLMDVLTDANDILRELGVHFEHSASEATAAATLAGVVLPGSGADMTGVAGVAKVAVATPPTVLSDTRGAPSMLQRALVPRRPHLLQRRSSVPH